MLPHRLLPKVPDGNRPQKPKGAYCLIYYNIKTKNFK